MAHIYFIFSYYTYVHVLPQITGYWSVSRCWQVGKQVKGIFICWSLTNTSLCYLSSCWDIVSPKSDRLSEISDAKLGLFGSHLASEPRHWYFRIFPLEIKALSMEIDIVSVWCCVNTGHSGDHLEHHLIQSTKQIWVMKCRKMLVTLTISHMYFSSISLRLFFFMLCMKTVEISWYS